MRSDGIRTRVPALYVLPRQAPPVSMQPTRGVLVVRLTPQRLDGAHVAPPHRRIDPLRIAALARASKRIDAHIAHKLRRKTPPVVPARHQQGLAPPALARERQ